MIIPISRVAFGFAAGGGEYKNQNGESSGGEDECGQQSQNKYPFAGGSGAGVSINPVAFMVVGQDQIKLLPVNINSSIEKILDLIPDVLGKANDTIKRKIKIRKEIKNNGETTSKVLQDVEDE